MITCTAVLIAMAGSAVCSGPNPREARIRRAVEALRATPPPWYLWEKQLRAPDELPAALDKCDATVALLARMRRDEQIEAEERFIAGCHEVLLERIDRKWTPTGPSWNDGDLSALELLEISQGRSPKFDRVRGTLSFISYSGGHFKLPTRPRRMLLEANWPDVYGFAAKLARLGEFAVAVGGPTRQDRIPAGASSNPPTQRHELTYEWCCCTNGAGKWQYLIEGGSPSAGTQTLPVPNC